MKRARDCCVLSPLGTAALAVVWIGLPTCGIVLLTSIIGPCWELAYLAAVTLVPAALALAAPLVRATTDARKHEVR